MPKARKSMKITAIGICNHRPSLPNFGHKRHSTHSMGTTGPKMQSYQVTLATLQFAIGYHNFLLGLQIMVTGICMLLPMTDSRWTWFLFWGCYYKHTIMHFVMSTNTK